MNKLFQYTSVGWVAASFVKLPKAAYDALSDLQKTDGTLYIVDED